MLRPGGQFRQRRFSTEALAGLAGALIGFAGSYAATVHADHAANAREERQADREVQGAARSLIDELATVSTYLGVAVDSKQYIKLDPEYTIDIAPDALRALYGRMTVKEYARVTGAIRFAGTMRVLLRQGQEGQALDQQAIDVLNDSVCVEEAGVDALRRLGKVGAHTPQRSVPIGPTGCPDPGSLGG